MCVCVVILFILDVRLVDVPTEVTQDEGHTGFLHLPSAVLALIFLAGRIQPFLSLVDREVEFLREYLVHDFTRKKDSVDLELTTKAGFVTIHDA